MTSISTISSEPRRHLGHRNGKSSSFKSMTIACLILMLMLSPTVNAFPKRDSFILPKTAPRKSVRYPNTAIVKPFPPTKHRAMLLPPKVSQHFYVVSVLSLRAGSVATVEAGRPWKIALSTALILQGIAGSYYFKRDAWTMGDKEQDWKYSKVYDYMHKTIRKRIQDVAAGYFALGNLAIYRPLSIQTETTVVDSMIRTGLLVSTVLCFWLFAMPERFAKGLSEPARTKVESMLDETDAEPALRQKVQEFSVTYKTLQRVFYGLCGIMNFLLFVQEQDIRVLVMLTSFVLYWAQAKQLKMFVRNRGTIGKPPIALQVAMSMTYAILTIGCACSQIRSRHQVPLAAASVLSIPRGGSQEHVQTTKTQSEANTPFVRRLDSMSFPFRLVALLILAAFVGIFGVSIPWILSSWCVNLAIAASQITRSSISLESLLKGQIWVLTLGSLLTGSSVVLATQKNGIVDRLIDKAQATFVIESDLATIVKAYPTIGENLEKLAVIGAGLGLFLLVHGILFRNFHHPILGSNPEELIFEPALLPWQKFRSTVADCFGILLLGTSYLPQFSPKEMVQLESFQWKDWIIQNKVLSSAIHRLVGIWFLLNRLALLGFKITDLTAFTASACIPVCSSLIELSSLVSHDGETCLGLKAKTAKTIAVALLMAISVGSMLGRSHVWDSPMFF